MRPATRSCAAATASDPGSSLLHFRAMKVDDALAETTVLNLQDEPVALGTLWSEQPVVLVWLRHYG